ncbi:MULTISPECIES: ABC transporter ATP-binding protein [Achromobacter]|uniref:ATP-binding cassette domain-containing protein n=1 Tax=Achromobacter aegrifaciens TaxID=1287736 RepID=A0AAD2J673_ACHAE|nr:MULTISPECIES: ATP-binding cassette domain-containing protein [Achromobacter]MBD9384053.1 ABC transporter ATP-binding protein [Achromobacter sp. ACM02]MBD9417853.1 ABC transporter ATP-binding protein [Achromobacter sp. ACM04]MBD9433461.1 ABC transporter ATP-binding protein [Achromobacter sp. ACM03]MBD9472937.1 ABC transporter ATP-binding protein [Achromobacter sp. ACM01]MDQ1764127.1 ATP-binding cassette domain-containing protein [Achromobacter aegrifaciens]
MPLLQISGIQKRFGGLLAVNGAGMDVADGELLGLIGPNGSGKTTLLNVLSGHLAADAGQVLLDGRSVMGLNPTRLTRLGVLRMFQMTRVFNRVSAYDNLIVCGLAMGLDEAAASRRALELLDELKLTHVMHLDAGQLSGGQKKLLEFGACFMAPPRIALLDEPFAAVHPVMKETMSEFIRRRNQSGQTFILVSHDMPVVVDLCARSVCMNAGRVLADGPTQQVLREPAVIEAYLGEPGQEEQDHA